MYLVSYVRSKSGNFMADDGAGFAKWALHLEFYKKLFSCS